MESGHLETATYPEHGVRIPTRCSKAAVEGQVSGHCGNSGPACDYSTHHLPNFIHFLELTPPACSARR